MAALRPFLTTSYSAVSGTEQDTELRYRMSAGNGGDGIAGGPAQPETDDLDPDPEKLALALREQDAVSPRGVALAEQLLTDGTGPLYIERTNDALWRAAVDALEALRA